ncbi:hypothetical protein GUJ93_ZPchr0013g36995 [Zizania palustris]|uniref:Uncharacterized protein n=1 Tax=Zizania palustris TaxID=103762 RepID=A0A8J5WWP5_ZIZPA|nr:hypothetical protein GUJ93_ZPchr0013g36995 [Zizania palustris]
MIAVENVASVLVVADAAMLLGSNPGCPPNPSEARLQANTASDASPPPADSTDTPAGSIGDAPQIQFPPELRRIPAPPTPPDLHSAQGLPEPLPRFSYIVLMDRRSWPWKKKSSDKSSSADASQNSNQAEQVLQDL